MKRGGQAGKLTIMDKKNPANGSCLSAGLCFGIFWRLANKGIQLNQEIPQWERPYDATRDKVVDYAAALVQQNAVVMYPYEHAPGVAYSVLCHGPQADTAGLQAHFKRMRGRDEYMDMHFLYAVARMTGHAIKVLHMKTNKDGGDVQAEWMVCSPFSLATPADIARHGRERWQSFLDEDFRRVLLPDTDVDVLVFFQIPPLTTMTMTTPTRLMHMLIMRLEFTRMCHP